MKKFIASTLSAAMVSAFRTGYDHIQYNQSADVKYNTLPNSNYNIEVKNFNEWDPVWGQRQYEGRLETEATLMIALESLREALGDIDREIE